MKRKGAALVLAVLGVACAARAGAERDQPRDVEVRAVASIQHSGFREKTFAVLRSPREAAAAWSLLWNGRPPPLPPVDFGREMLVLAALGERPSAGFEVAFADAVPEGDVLKIGVVEVRPAAGCAVATVLTTPAAVAALPRFEGRVERLDFVVTERCAPAREDGVPVPRGGAPAPRSGSGPPGQDVERRGLGGRGLRSGPAAAVTRPWPRAARAGS